MKAKAVLFMLMMTFVVSTGFAISHGNPGQNSKADIHLSDSGTAHLTVITDVQVFVIDNDIAMKVYQPVDVNIQTSIVYPPDSLSGGSCGAAGFNISKAVPIDRKLLKIRQYKFERLWYLYKGQLVEVVRMLQVNKPRDSLIRNE